MVLMIVRIIPFLFNIDQVGISLGHICFPSVPPFPQKYQQNESLPEAIMVGRDRDRFFAVSFLNKGGQSNWIDTCLQKKCSMNAKSWCCFTELRVLLSGGLCLRRAAAKSARAASVREVWNLWQMSQCWLLLSFLKFLSFPKFLNFPKTKLFNLWRDSLSLSPGTGIFKD